MVSPFWGSHFAGAAANEPAVSKAPTNKANLFQVFMRVTQRLNSQNPPRASPAACRDIRRARKSFDSTESNVYRSNFPINSQSFSSPFLHFHSHHYVFPFFMSLFCHGTKDNRCPWSILPIHQLNPLTFKMFRVVFSRHLQITPMFFSYIPSILAQCTHAKFSSNNSTTFPSEIHFAPERDGSPIHQHCASAWE